MSINGDRRLEAEPLPAEEAGRYFCRAPYPAICYDAATQRRGADLKCDGHAQAAGWQTKEQP